MIKAESFIRDLSAFGGLIFFILLIIVTSFFEHYLAQKLFWGFVLTYFIAVVIRLFYFKERPHSESYNNIIEKIDASSFPSLHTARIFFIMLTMVFYEFWLIIVFLPVALLTSYARIHMKRHDWIDVIGGMLLGIITFFLLLF